ATPAPAPPPRAPAAPSRAPDSALPRALTPEQRLELVQDFVRQEAGERHAWSFAIHNPKPNINISQKPKKQKNKKKKKKTKKN
ncbi:MobA/MobL family protein, partial [Escherichia coli]|nr:MobA/MobL family protein [Escherichia coli]